MVPYFILKNKSSLYQEDKKIWCGKIGALCFISKASFDLRDLGLLHYRKRLWEQSLNVSNKVESWMMGQTSAKNSTVTDILDKHCLDQKREEFTNRQNTNLNTVPYNLIDYIRLLEWHEIREGSNEVRQTQLSSDASDLRLLHWIPDWLMTSIKISTLVLEDVWHKRRVTKCTRHNSALVSAFCIESLTDDFGQDQHISARW